MLEILKTLFSSKKFLVMLAGIILAVANKLGLDLDPELVNQILALVGVYIVGQGIADRGKVTKVTDGPAIGLALILIVSSTAGLSSGCATFKSSATGAASSFVDCLAPNTKALAGELQGTVSDVIRNATDNTGKVDWSAVRSSVRSYKSDAPLCAFQAAVRGMLLAARAPKDPDAPQSAGLEVDAASLLTGYESVRLELFATRLQPLELVQ